MIKWKIRNKIVLFPEDWNKDRVMKWINAKHIRMCPICNKLDVTYDHFNNCNPSEQRVAQQRIDDMW